MAEDTGGAQARELLRQLHEHADKISHQVDAVAGRRRRTSARGAMMQRQQLSCLRQELYEAHRLIEGLHRRFPEALATQLAYMTRPVHPSRDQRPTANMDGVRG